MVTLSIFLSLSLFLSVQGQLLNFTVVGDYGLVQDLQYAKQLFSAINNHTQEGHPFSFFITVGDNIYPSGIMTPWDSAMQNVMTECFQNFAQLKDKPIYSTLGNHDCYGNQTAQVDYSNYNKNWIMPSDYYSRNFYQMNQVAQVQSEYDYLVGMMFLNGCKLVCKDRISDGECKNMNITSQKQIQDHYDWISSQLANIKLNSKWTMMANHYPIHSKDSSGDRDDYKTNLLPLLQSLDFFFMGHSHDMQYLTFQYNQQKQIENEIDSETISCYQNIQILQQSTRVKKWKKGQRLQQFLIGSGGMPPEGQESMSPLCPNQKSDGELWYGFNKSTAYARVEVWEEKIDVIYLDKENNELFRGIIEDGQNTKIQ